MISSLRNYDDSFYELMGRFFGSREVEREIGAKVYDDPGRIWIIALEEDRVIGFVSYDIIKNIGHIRSSYTLPEHRGKGTYKKLFAECLKQLEKAGVKVIKSTVNNNSKPMYEVNGFAEVGTAGRFAKMEKTL